MEIRVEKETVQFQRIQLRTRNNKILELLALPCTATTFLNHSGWPTWAAQYLKMSLQGARAASQPLSPCSCRYCPWCCAPFYNNCKNETEKWPKKGKRQKRNCKRPLTTIFQANIRPPPRSLLFLYSRQGDSKIKWKRAWQGHLLCTRRLNTILYFFNI